MAVGSQRAGLVPNRAGKNLAFLEFYFRFLGFLGFFQVFRFFRF